MAQLRGCEGIPLPIQNMPIQPLMPGPDATGRAGLAQRLSLGLIETLGLAAAVEAADAAVKAANVRLLGYELTRGDGMTTVKVLGEVGAVNAAIAAARVAAARVNGVVSTRVIARPAEGIAGLIFSADTVGMPRPAVAPPVAPEPEPAPAQPEPAPAAPEPVPAPPEPVPTPPEPVPAPPEPVPAAPEPAPLPAKPTAKPPQRGTTRKPSNHKK